MATVPASASLSPTTSMYGTLEPWALRMRLPRVPAQGVADIDVDLRAVEGGVALVDDVGDPLGLEGLTQGVGGQVPTLVGADALLGVSGRELGLEGVEAEVPQHPGDEAKQALQLR